MTTNHSEPSVLIVEDDPSLRTVLSRVVKHLQPLARVEWSETGTEALARIRSKEKRGEGEYDLILADLLLPNSELGTSVWRYCRQHQPRTPFALMSSVDPTTYFRMFKGSEEPPPFLPKPFRVEDCRDLLSFLMKGHNDGSAFGG